ncbi:YbaB/EbfC DNA-binding family protein [Amycolatopsis arida]|uniref:YbaB/EbfC DNA-binding family protein n=1 Tax=Amycolatopsis arida TaxID=587909 RepID=A0A1I6A3K7_9PSEU|nr:YbaB/EbfC family nucleoid-associated protein [Amycolatopsis arida]TDX88645.1 YbaB/EbfC DNA-binding family protein [Amycolatopsis arida]SFQ63183.1 YbaB/EbfC DNA-binding family protein [Amycolatopsis arida]
MSAEFEQLVAQFERFQSRLRKVDDQLANLGEMRSEIAELEATATSDDRSVTVVAGPGGAIKDVRFTEKALAQTPQALSSAVVFTIQQAVAEAARRQAAIVDGHFGGDMHLTDQVVETQAELFGTSPEELRERLAEERPARRPAREEHPDDDYSQRSVLTDDDAPPRPAPPPSPGGSAGDEFLKNLFDEEDR